MKRSRKSRLEREPIRDRTVAGLESARARGRTGGRRPALTKRQVELASRMMRDEDTRVEDVCAAVGGVSRSTFYRYVAPDGTVRQMPMS